MVINLRKWSKPNIRNSNPDHLLPSEERTSESVLNRFTHDVSDQIALALNITSSLDIDNKEYNLENIYYLNDAFSYILNAMANFGAFVHMSPDFARYQGDDFNLISKHKMENLVLLAEKILKKISDFWKENNCIDEHKKELQRIEMLIKGLKNTLNLNE